MQNNTTRFIFGFRKYDHISKAFKSLGLLNMKNRMLTHSLTLMHKLTNKNGPKYLLDKIDLTARDHTYDTRTKHLAMTSKYNNNFGANRFLNSITRLYNSVVTKYKIPSKISVPTFKLKIKSHFLDQQLQQ